MKATKADNILIGLATTALSVMAVMTFSSISMAQEGSNIGDGESASKLKTEDVQPQLTKEQLKQKIAPEKVERIKVTGSHIKRIDIEGPSPIKVIDREELDRSGYNSVSDVLRDTTINSFGSMREHSGSNAAGVAHVNLRGLGSSSTLVLLNGQRLPTDGVTGAVDLNLIPMAAIERIEVLKDGASALYGSDALGGVVNLITRKDFSDTEVSIQQSAPEQVGGKKTEVSVVNGITTKKVNMVNVVHYRNNETIFARDREWSDDGVSMTGSPGSWREIEADGSRGPWQADPNCPAGRIVTLPNGGGSRCSYRYSDRSTSLPALEQVSVMSSTTVNLSSSVKLKARVGATQKNSEWTYAPAPDSTTVDADTAADLGLGGVGAGSGAQISYRMEELGDRVSEVDEKSYNALLGTTVELGDTWELDVDTAYNHVNRFDAGVGGYALRDRVESAFQDGRFRPNNPAGSRGSLLGAAYVPTQDTTSELTSINVQGAGELFETPSGPISLAIGSSYIFQKFEDVLDEQSEAGNVYGSAGSSGGGQRDVRSAFSELSIPVSTFMELQLAGRYDQYSDFGETFNPKAAARFQATKSLMFRTSVGTGFKAPLMQDLYASTSEGYPTFIDAVACDQEKAAGGATPSCTPAQYLVESGGNPGLKEEKSISYNAGMMFQPTRNFNIGSDLWFTKMENVVGIDYGDITEAEKAGIDVSKSGVTVNRTNGYIDSIEAPLQNLSAQEAFGIDMQTSGRIGRFTLGMEHSHMFYFKEEGFPGTGLRDKLGENGRPTWRNTMSLGFNVSDSTQFSVSARTVAGHEKAVAEEGSLEAYTEADLQASMQIGPAKITGGIKNIAGTTPPLDDSNPNGQLDSSIYDQIGRQVYAGVKATF